MLSIWLTATLEFRGMRSSLRWSWLGMRLAPLDLVSDFIPVVGYLDDLILVPLGITLALNMIPPDVMAESRVKAAAVMREGKPRTWASGVVIVVIWLLLLALSIVVVARLFT